MSNFFNDDGPVSEYDQLQDSEPAQEYVEEDTEEFEELEEVQADIDEMVEEVSYPTNSSYSLNKQERSVVSEAMLRLEQARLYEMLLKHDLFAGVKTNQTAKHNVESELKKFILDRFEILLGIKTETQNTPMEMTVDLPFNDVEVEFLKALAYKGTNGASLGQGSAQATISKVNSLPQAKPVQEGLRPMVQARPQVKQITPVAKSVQKQVVKPVAKPVQRPPVKQPLSKPTSRPTPKKARTLDEIAREDLKRMQNRKPHHEMTAKELKIANKQVEGSRVRKYPAGAIPMPTAEQQVNNIIITKSATDKNKGFNDMLSRALGSVPLETIADEY